jgi:membrane-associated phospholipid phosphatase
LPHRRPYPTTPPFGKYPSSHSTFSAAAAAVLARFTGSDRFGAAAADLFAGRRPGPA